MKMYMGIEGLNICVNLKTRTIGIWKTVKKLESIKIIWKICVYITACKLHMYTTLDPSNLWTHHLERGTDKQTNVSI